MGKGWVGCGQNGHVADNDPELDIGMRLVGDVKPVLISGLEGQNIGRNDFNEGTFVFFVLLLQLVPLHHFVIIPLKHEVTASGKTLLKSLDFLGCHRIRAFSAYIIVAGHVNLDSFGIENPLETSDITFECFIIAFRSII